MDPISDLNGVSPEVALRAGLQVLLPMPNDQVQESSLARSVGILPKKEERRRSRRHPHKYYKINYKHRESARNVPSSWVAHLNSSTGQRHLKCAKKWHGANSAKIRRELQSPHPERVWQSQTVLLAPHSEGHRVVVVVSAMGDTTDDLIELAQRISKGSTLIVKWTCF